MFGNVHPCQGKADCTYLYECVDYLCQHKNVWPPEMAEVLGLFWICIITGFASLAGIGGGVMMVPILTFFFNYSQKEAIIVVFVPICGAALGNFLNLSRQKDPATQTPIVNVRAAIVTCPIMFFASIFGLIINKFLSAFILIFTLSILIVRATKKFYLVAKKDYFLENERKKFNREKKNQLKMIEMSLVSDDECDQIGIKENFQNYKQSQQTQTKTSRTNQTNSGLVLLGAVFIILFLISFFLIRGTSQLKSFFGYKYCGTEYWILTFLLGMACLILQWIYFRTFIDEDYFNSIQSLKQDQSFIPYQRMMRSYIFEPIKAGLLNAFGLGGGMYLIPMYLSFGFSSIQATGTSSFNVLMTSSLILFQILTMGTIQLSMAVQLFIFSTLGCYISSKIIFEVLSRIDRLSIIMMALVVQSCLSFFGLYYKFFQNWAALNFRFAELYRFSEFC